MRFFHTLFMSGLAIIVLAGCTTVPSSDEKVRGAANSRKNTGKYYLDDGPLNGISDETIAAIPEPVPKQEPIYKWTQRPYTALGKTFVPMKKIAPYREKGVASWYGTRYHGQKTAIGERYDMLKMTAAHPTLPLPSYARVTNLENGKSVVVRVNDRGPFLRDRIIDLSYAAARRLGYVAKGSALVEVELLQP